MRRSRSSSGSISGPSQWDCKSGLRGCTTISDTYAYLDPVHCQGAVSAPLPALTVPADVQPHERVTTALQAAEVRWRGGLHHLQRAAGHRELCGGGAQPAAQPGHPGLGVPGVCGRRHGGKLCKGAAMLSHPSLHLHLHPPGASHRCLLLRPSQMMHIIVDRRLFYAGGGFDGAGYGRLQSRQRCWH